MVNDAICCGLGCWFGCTGVVMMCLRVLSHDVLYVQEILNSTGGIIAKYVELWIISNCLKLTVDTGEGFI